MKKYALTPSIIDIFIYHFPHPNVKSSLFLPMWRLFYRFNYIVLNIN